MHRATSTLRPAWLGTTLSAYSGSSRHGELRHDRAFPRQTHTLALLGGEGSSQGVSLCFPQLPPLASVSTSWSLVWVTPLCPPLCPLVHRIPRSVRTTGKSCSPPVEFWSQQRRLLSGVSLDGQDAQSTWRTLLLAGGEPVCMAKLHLESDRPGL